MQHLRTLTIGVTLLMSACDGSPESTSLTGTYLPNFANVSPSDIRLARASADRSWVFSPDGTVVTTSQRGALKWRYEVRGKEIRLRGADSRNQGESRRFTFADKGCIWDGSGRSSVDTRFCPAVSGTRPTGR